MTTADEIRAKVEALSARIDPAAYMENAYDMGLREDADDDGLAFWAEVYAQVTA